MNAPDSTIDSAADSTTGVTADRPRRPVLRWFGRTALSTGITAVVIACVLVGGVQLAQGISIIVEEETSDGYRTETTESLMYQNDSAGADALENAGLFDGPVWDEYLEAMEEHVVMEGALLRDVSLERIGETVWVPGVRQYLDWAVNLIDVTPLPAEEVARGNVYLMAQTLCATLRDKEGREGVSDVLSGLNDGIGQQMVTEVDKFTRDGDSCAPVNAHNLGGN